MLSPYLTGQRIEYWLGLTDKAQEGTWRWESGSRLSNDWQKWKGGEPNNAKGNEDCAAVAYDDEKNPHVLDINCGWKRPVVCVKMTCKFHKLLFMNH